jgi:hypothetical protein
MNPSEPVGTKDEEQLPLFDSPPSWADIWKAMPEYRQQDLTPWQTVYVHFRNEADRQAFADLIGQKVTDRTKFVWYPPAEIGRYADKRFRAATPTYPRYPVYIISKGRWESRLTSKSLETIHIPYWIVVEPQEYALYASVINPGKILVLPFSNLGQGSIPARNWVWEHSLALGAERHWILDDNIYGFYRLYNNLKTPVADGAIFRAAEDFTDRYQNVGLSGFNYFMFANRKEAVPPLYINTRIYSCILIDNYLPHRWRGRYNEDTDLSLRVLKDGLCTILFNTFLARKQPTMSMRGGNTKELYQGDGRLLMAESLKEQHPDAVTITRKWGRWQHQVNYKPFRTNKLILKPGIAVEDGSDNFGMYLEIDGNG